jgi:hypothetical protein
MSNNLEQKPPCLKILENHDQEYEKFLNNYSRLLFRQVH